MTTGTASTIDRAIRTYLDHLSIEKGLAANTLSSYRRDLRRYREFLDEKAVTTLDEVAEATVTDFLVRLREGDQVHPPLSASSAARTVVAVRGFHRFAVADGLATLDPAAAVKPPSPAKRLPKALPLADVEAILEAAGAPGDALAAGIGMVHQHFMLVPVFTVAENVMLGHEQTRGPGVLNRNAARKQVRELSDRYRLHVDPDALVEDIPVGVQQRVEIIKALASHAKILILDEPTAVLTPQEIDELMGIMRELKAQGTSIIFITHKLREVKAIGDRISVIRRGKLVGTAPPTASEQELAEMMVGRDVQLVVGKDEAKSGEPVLRAEGISVVDPRGHVVVKDVSFEARAGEVLGIAGVQGNGQTELIKSLLGLIKPDAGRVELNGKDISKHGPRQSLEDGIGYIPEDRSHDGYVGTFSVRENLVLDLYRSDEFSSGPALRLDKIAANAKARIEEFDIRTESAETPVASLSGGNQQKVVVAREFSRPLKVLIASQPTRGVDVGSIEFIHKRIIHERDLGTAVVIVSTELDEIYALSDRIAVMYDGRIVATVSPDTPREELGLLMAGATPEDRAGGTLVQEVRS